MTAAERKAAERERKRALGLVAVTVWVPARDKPAIEALAEHLAAPATEGEA